MANEYIGEAKAKLTIDSSNIEKNILDKLNETQKTVNKKPINVSVNLTGMSKKDITNSISIYKKQIDNINKMNSLYNKSGKEQSRTDFYMDYINDFVSDKFPTMKGNEFEIDFSKITKELSNEFMIMFQSAIANGMKINDFKEFDDYKVFDFYKSLSSNIGYIDPSDILKDAESQIDKLTETIKIMNSETNKSMGIKDLLEDFSDFAKDKSHKNLSDFFIELQKKIDDGDESLISLLRHLKLLGENETKLNLINAGGVNEGGIIGKERVLKVRNDRNGRYEEHQNLLTKLKEFKRDNKNINVSRIIELEKDFETNMFMEIEETLKGKFLGYISDYAKVEDQYVNAGFLTASQKQIDKLVTDIITYYKGNIGLDLNTTNILYDKKEGFNIIDYDLRPANYDSYNSMIGDAIGGIIGDIENYYFDTNAKKEDIEELIGFKNKLIDSFNKHSSNIPELERGDIYPNETIVDYENYFGKIDENTNNKIAKIYKEIEQDAKQAKEEVEKLNSKVEELKTNQNTSKNEPKVIKNIKEEAVKAIDNVDKLNQKVTELNNDDKKGNISSDIKKENEDLKNQVKIKEEIVNQEKKIIEEKKKATKEKEKEKEKPKVVVKKKNLPKISLVPDRTTTPPSDIEEKIEDITKEASGAKEEISGISKGLDEIADKKIDIVKPVEKIEKEIKEASNEVIELNNDIKNIGQNKIDVKFSERDVKKEESKEQIKIEEQSEEQTNKTIKAIDKKSEAINQLKKCYVELHRVYNLLPKREYDNQVDKFYPLVHEADYKNIKKYMDLEKQEFALNENLLKGRKNNPAVGKNISQSIVQSFSLYTKLEKLIKENKDNTSFKYQAKDLEDMKIGIVGLYKEYYKYYNSFDKMDPTIRSIGNEWGFVPEIEKYFNDLKNYNDETNRILKLNRTLIESYKRLEDTVISAFKIMSGKDIKDIKPLIPEVLYDRTNKIYDVNGVFENSFSQASSLLGIKVDKTEEEIASDTLYSQLKNTELTIDNFSDIYKKYIDIMAKLPERKYEKPDKNLDAHAENFNYLKKYLSNRLGSTEKYLSSDYMKDFFIGKSSHSKDLALSSIKTTLKDTYDEYNKIQTAIKNNKGKLHDTTYSEADLNKLKKGIRSLFVLYHENNGDLDDLGLKMSKPFMDLKNQMSILLKDADTVQVKYNEETLKIIENNFDLIKSFSKLSDEITESFKKFDPRNDVSKIVPRLSLQDYIGNNDYDLKNIKNKDFDQVSKLLGIGEYKNQEISSVDSFQKEVDVLDDKIDKTKELNQELKEQQILEKDLSNILRETQSEEKKKEEIKQKDDGETVAKSSVKNIKVQKNLKKAIKDTNAEIQKQNDLQKENVSHDITKKSETSKPEKKVQVKQQSTAKIPSDLLDIENASNKVEVVNKELANAAKETYKQLNKEGNVASKTADYMNELAKGKDNASEANKKLGNVALETTEKLKEERDIVKALKKVEEKQSKSNTSKDNKTENSSKKKNVLTEQEKVEIQFEKDKAKLIKSLRNNYNTLDKKRINEPQKIAYLDEYISKLNKLDQELISLKKISDKDSLDKKVKTIKILIDELNSSSYKAANKTKVANMIKDITNYLDENEKITRKSKVKLIELRDTLESFDGTGEELQEILRTFLKIQDASVRSGNFGKSFFGNIKDQMKHLWEKGIAQWFSLYDIIRYLQEGFREVVSINTAMTELKKVSSATANQIDSSFTKMVDSAKDYGSSVNDMIAATADWSRNGYNLPDSQYLAEMSVLYKNVGDGIDIDSANESLISTLKGFQLEAKDAMSIIDKFNEVANNMPIDSAGIGESLKRSAAAFNAANTDLSESIALVTGTNAILQDVDKTGNMWATVAARIRGTKTELVKLGEETDMYVESTSKMRDLVKGMTHFDIMKDEHTYKSIYEIIVGIGKEWDKLNDKDQAALLEALAGKRQSNALAAALNNVEMIEETYKISENSAGSALREQAKYEKSLQYSLDRLKASSQEFWAEFLNSDLLKNGIDLLNSLLQVLTKIISSPVATTGLLGSAVLLFAKLNVRKISFLMDALGDEQAIANIGFMSRNIYNLSGVLKILGDKLKYVLPLIKGFVAANPMVAIGVGAVAGGALLYSHFHKTLDEEIDESQDKAEIKIGIDSELETVQNELNDIEEKIQRINSSGLNTVGEEELSNLESEKTILEANLALMKEKQRIASEESEKESLDVVDKKIVTKTWETVPDENGEIIDQVTMDDDLIRLVDELKLFDAEELKVSNSINEIQEKMDKISDKRSDKFKELSEEAKSLEHDLNNLRHYRKQDEKYALEHADKLQAELPNLVGATGAYSLKRKGEIEESIQYYTNYIKPKIEKGIEENPPEAEPEVDIKLKNTALVTELKRQLEPAYKELQKAYEDIFTKDGKRGEKIFSLDKVNIDTFDSIKNSIDSLNELEGVDIDASSFEDFARVLGDADSNATQVQQAFDDLATAIIRGTMVSDTFSQETEELSVKLLSEMGVANASEYIHEKLAQAYIDAHMQEQLLTDDGLVNVTEAKVEALLKEAGATEITKKYLYSLLVAEVAFNNSTLDVSGKIASLESLAKAFNQTSIVAQFREMKDSGVSDSMIEEQIQNYSSGLNAALKDGAVEIDFDPVASGATKAAGKAGKDAGEKYLDELNKAISAVGSIIGDKIDAINKEKDAALKSLDLQIDVYQDQIDAIDDVIDDKNDLIDSINDEIDAMKEANDERQREIDLQKAKYDLERMQNQRTKLVYKEGSDGVAGQFVYETDTKGIRDARDAVEDAELNIRIAEKEKEIKVIEKQIEALEDQKDVIHEQIEAIEKQKEAVELFYQNMIDALNSYKDKWDRLSHLKDMAEAEAVLSKFGLSVNDVLNMSDEAFNNFANHYIESLAKANQGNDDFVASLERLSGLDLSGVSEGFTDVAESASSAVSAIAGGGTTSNEESGSGNASFTSEVNNKDSGGNSEGLGGAIQSAAKTATDEIPKISNLLAGDGEEGEGGTSVVGAVQKVIDKIGSGEEGDDKNNGAEGESDTLNSSIKNNVEIASNEDTGIPVITSKFEELNAQLTQTVDLLNQVKSVMESIASGEGSGLILSSLMGGGFRLTGRGEAEGTVGKAFATGHNNTNNWGLNNPLQNALVSEYGQQELTVLPNGDTILTDQPTMMDLPQDTVIFNERQTKKILNGKQKFGNAYSTGVNNNNLSPLQPGDKMYELLKKMNDSDLSNLPLENVSKNLVKASNALADITHNNEQNINVTLGDINLTGVQTPDALANAIVNKLPNAMTQALHRR